MFHQLIFFLINVEVCVNTTCICIKVFDDTLDVSDGKSDTFDEKFDTSSKHEQFLKLFFVYFWCKIIF
jgi:hypothetical protein